MIEIKIPILGESVVEGTLVRWAKQVGDFVAVDEMVAEIETDKITMEITAPSAGVLKDLKISEGETVLVGSVIGHIDETSLPKEEGEKAKKKTINTPKDSVIEEKILAPSAQKIVKEQGIDIQFVQGTGKSGRITKEDVLSMNISQKERRVPMTRLRQKIAERLKASQNTAALLTTFNEVDMSSVMALRERYKDRFFEKHGAKLGFMSFFVKAVIETLKEIPELNAEIDGKDILYKDYFNIGVAVGTDHGLVVPVLKNAEKLRCSDIEAAIASYAIKARDNTLELDDLSGGTFTISNGGVYGSLLSTPIVNPPQSGILGLHKIQKRPIVVGDTIVIRPMMYLALTYDHRIVDGKGAVTFLARVKERVESPETLLLDL